MGKVKPPAEVFGTWSPEAQNSYKCKLDEMAHASNDHRANAAEETKQAEHCEWASELYLKNAEEESPEGKGDIKDGAFGASMGNAYMGYKREAEGKEHRNNAYEETRKADEIDKEIERLRVDETDESSADLSDVKKQYKEDVKKSIKEDEDKLKEKKEKLHVWKDEFDDTWFIGKGELKKKIEELEKEIADIEEDVEFNKENLDNTDPQPKPPQAPAPPSIQTFVGMGAKLQCSFAIPLGTPALIVDPTRLTFTDGKPMANILDFKPMTNIPCMGMCSAPTNPAVIAATAAKLGVFTPVPCVPAIPAPWKPGDSTVLVENAPALLNTDTLQCMWGGIITILPG